MSKMWSLTPVGEFHYARWADSDEVVLYYSGSGNTYLISQLGYIILTQLQESEKNRETLKANLASLETPYDGTDSIPDEMIDSHLFHFEKLGLVVS